MKVIQGDLLKEFKDKRIGIIMHVCNCRGVMGAGFALSIKREFPKAYEKYKAYEKQFGLELGSFSLATISEDQCIINLHAQANYGVGERFISYDGLCTSLERTEYLIQNSHYLKDQTIGIPYLMGCGLAGGDWPIVESIFLSVFKGYQTIAVKL